MKNLIFCLIISFVITSYSIAQNTFQKVYGDLNYEAGFRVRQTMEGSYVVAGFKIPSGNIFRDGYLLKSNSAGDTIFTRTYGGNNDDYFNTVEQTTDSGFILVGQTASFGAGNEDIYVVRTNKSGDTLWTRAYGGADIYDEGYAVKQTTDGGFILLGNINNVGIGNQDVYLIKINGNGDTLWTKIFGGTGDDFGYGINQTSDGGYIIAGSNGSINAGFQKAYLIKTDSNGNLLWTKAYGGTLDDMVFDVIQLTDSGYLSLGWTINFGAGGYDIYLIRTDSYGNLIWSKTYGGTGNDIGNSFAKTNDGNFLIAGYSDSSGTFNDDNIYILKIDTGGVPIWSQVISTPGIDEAQSIHPTDDGGFIISGLTYLFNGNQLYFSYLIKTDSSGNAGCNEYNVSTSVTVPATSIMNSATMISSGGTVSNTTTQIRSGTTIRTLCSSFSNNEMISFNPKLLLSPNPSISKFTIDTKQGQIKQIEIFNLMGEKIYSVELSKVPFVVNCEQWPEGIYFVVASDAKGNKMTEMISVMR